MEPLYHLVIAHLHKVHELKTLIVADVEPAVAIENKNCNRLQAEQPRLSIEFAV
jgi:hypothetical protein